MKIDSYIISYIPLILLVVISIVAISGIDIVEFKVDAEYLTGMLTASSIIFGFWAILIQTKPKDVAKRLLYGALMFAFFMSFGLLLLSVIFIYLVALGRLPSVVALWFCMYSFQINAANLILALYHYKLKES